MRVALRLALLVPAVLTGVLTLGCRAHQSPFDRTSTVGTSIAGQIQEAFNRYCMESGWSVSRLQYLAISAVEGSDDEYVAAVDWDYRWWGGWCCFRVRDGRIQDLVWGSADVFVHQVRGTRDKRFQGILVHVWDRSHMGNGPYCLIHVHCGGIETLIETRGVDHNTHGDGLVLTREALNASLSDVNSDGFADVKLTGTLVQIAPADWRQEDTTNWTPAKPIDVCKVFLWNPALKRFERSTKDDVGEFE